MSHQCEKAQSFDLQGFEPFFNLLEYIDLTKICVILMSQTCRKFPNVAILSHRFNQKYWQLQTDNLHFLQVYDCTHQ